MAPKTLETDYLVIGAGAMGMAFTDSLIDHADVHVTLVDRRDGPGGHWRDAYPFVQLHQASLFYGVASTVLGNGELQTEGPEAGLQERAQRQQIVDYYDDVLQNRLVGSGRVTFLGGHDYDEATSNITVRRRVVDATYLSPTIPATTPPPFGVDDAVRCIPINELPHAADAPNFVIVGSGKTATDGIIWLLGEGVPADRIMWVRPRDPWMLNRAVVQPNAKVAISLAADTMTAAAEGDSLDDVFVRLEADGVMLRLDTNVVPTMAKTPTLGTWELDLLRTIENVVRLGHITGISSSEIVLVDGSVPLPTGAVVVHCAASGLAYPERVPIWQPDRIRLQTVRAGFPCFNAALIGLVEATRDDDTERNRLCPPNVLPNSLPNWAEMQARGMRATRAFGAEPDIAAWMNGCALNPSRVQPEERELPEVQAASARLGAVAERGLERLTEFAGL